MSGTPRRDDAEWRVDAGDGDGPVGGDASYAELLGLDPGDAVSLHQALLEGLAFASVEHLAHLLDLPLTDVSRFALIPYRTLLRRRREGRLPPVESDRMARLARLAARARGLFSGDMVATRQWLAEPQYGLGGRVPFEFAATEVGAREVEHLIGRIEWGIPL